jgi:hypothetical protein
METTTITINLDALLASVDAARAATTERRWLNAIETAYDWLLQQDSVEFNAEMRLIVDSPSGQRYLPNGSCQCKAHKEGNPCWHRAARQLVCRMAQVVAQQEKERQVKALGVRLAERRRAYTEIEELF